MDCDRDTGRLLAKKKFDPDATSECMDLISTLEQSDKLHSNNKEIIVWSKEFRTIARKYYTKDETTFLVFQNALKDYIRVLHPALRLLFRHLSTVNLKISY